ncbi:hypothetical protein GCM10017783_04500 [Deinococcus piscis]|uniref:DUF2726 domain-containing protein n=1 Tax=Deinococcus piscis TaxID=394230 RepID=A0ABQ3K0Z2_9DEIO|nr:DUF2726 domain-containing protein [Deinococcus piscis]GHF95693.1 hypothetical protein GCM10017783_04500 [Deinococcus piscis]
MHLKKRIVNHTEQRLLEDLRETGLENNFHVEPNQRIADIIQVEKGEIPDNEFYFALSSHFDFTVCQDWEPRFVIEFDGPHHEEPEQQRKDAIKDRICETVGLPILRLDSNLIRNQAREYSLAQWFAEIWFLAQEFDRMQSDGQIPYDEPFIYHSILGHVGGPLNFPYDIARPVLAFMQELYQSGKTEGYTAKTISYESGKDIICLAYFKVSSKVVVKSRIQFKRFKFYPIAPSELASDLAIKNLEDKIVEAINTGKGGISVEKARQEIARIEAECQKLGQYVYSQGSEL